MLLAILLIVIACAVALFVLYKKHNAFATTVVTKLEAVEQKIAGYVKPKL